MDALIAIATVFAVICPLAVGFVWCSGVVSDWWHL